MYYYSSNIINYLFSFLFISVWWQCQLPQSCQGWKPGKGPGVSQGQYRHQYLQRCKIYSSFFLQYTCQTSIKMNRADIYPYFSTLVKIKCVYYIFLEVCPIGSKPWLTRFYIDLKSIKFVKFMQATNSLKFFLSFRQRPL